MNSRLLQSCLLAFAAVLNVACDADSQAAGGSFADEMPEPLPAGQCAGSTSGTDGCDTDGTGVDPTTPTTGGDTSDACAESTDCLGEGVCAAAWDAEAQERGSLACEFACVAALDETRWCGDASSCCDAEAVCTARGYCVLPEPQPTSTTTGERSGGSESSGAATTGDTE